MTRDEAVAAATSGRHDVYHGDLVPDVGDAMWDPGERCWAVRVLADDIPYSCGIDCCGIDEYAVVAVLDETRPAATLPLDWTAPCRDAADLLAEARKRHRGAARAYGRAADGPGREVALVELERAAVVAVMAAVASAGVPPEVVAEMLNAAQRGLGL